MFLNKKPNLRPHGVPLDMVLAALNNTNLKARQEGDSLIVQHPSFITRVDVIPPANRESEKGPIQAVVLIRTPLPAEVASMFTKPEMTSAMNAMTTVGALTAESGKVFVGSRLTMYENENAWNIHFPLILIATISGTDSILGAMRRMMTREEGADSPSSWTEDEFETISSYLSRMCVCTTGGLGLTAEFGLRVGETSAIAGDHRTALWELRADQPHPEMGGGLFCLLQMPHQLKNETRLDEVLLQLNRMEMAPHDVPPHFGAWCRGRLGNNPAYVSFLPNALHAATGIAVNVSFWAFNRAQWANAMLASLGVSA